MNVTIGEIENNQLPKIGNSDGNSNGSGNSNDSNAVYICPRVGNCVSRSDPNYIIPKSYGKEKIDDVFTDITTLDGFENNKKGLIVEACHPKNLESNECQTRKCAVNEDCLSGLCQSGSCVINRDNQLSECSEKLGLMICKKYLQEPCIATSECAGRCKDMVCTYKHLNSLNTSSWVYYSVSIATSICLILLFLCCCCCPGIFSWKVKQVRNNNNPAVVV